jgi:hypothetical protein
MRIIQVYNNEGEKIGLYKTSRTDDQVDQDIIDAFPFGEARREQYLEMGFEEEIDPRTETDEYLEEKKGITRVFVDEVTI